MTDGNLIMMSESRRHQIFPIAGSVLVHLVLIGVIMSASLGPVSDGPGTVEVFMADGKEALMIAGPVGPQGQAGNHDAEKQSRAPMAGKDLTADLKNESKPVGSDQRSASRVPAPSMMKQSIMDEAPPLKEQGPAVQGHGDKEARTLDAAWDSQSSKGPVQDTAGLARAELRSHLSPGAIYSGEFGGNNGPRFREQVMPVYPDSARRRGKEDKVVLKLVVDETGRLTHMEVIETAGFGFDEAAVNAVRESTFVPARINGSNVMSEAFLTVRFVLQ